MTRGAPSAGSRPSPTRRVHSYVVDGRRLEVVHLAVAPGAQPTLVLLHEGLGSVAQWKDFPEKLAVETGLDVLVYSRYGHGGSDALEEPRSPGYMHHEAEVVLPSLLAQAGIAQPVLLGHSDGASIALIFAGRFPDAPRALILEAPHVFVEPLTIGNIAQAKVAFETTDLRARLERHHAHVDAMFRGWNDIWLDPAFRTWNIESALDTIRCPTLVIQCEDDEYGTLAQVTRIQAHLPQTEVAIWRTCGHAPHRYQTTATVERIVAFLDAHGYLPRDAKRRTQS